MSKLSKFLILVVVVTGVVLVGLVLSRRNAPGPDPDLQASATEPTASAPEATNGSSFFTRHEPRKPSQNQVREEAPAVASVATNPVPAWEDKLEEILGSASPDAEKARQMLVMFPTLPADGQEEVAQHLSNLVPDQDYGLLRTYLTNAALPEDVLDVLLDDVLNRPNSLKLPGLLDIARSEQHPKAAEAKDFLELLLEEDYGNDWSKWQAGVEQWLKANPD
jgi:hypothetical protein